MLKSNKYGSQKKSCFPFPTIKVKISIIFSRLLREGLPALLRPDRQDGGRELQPHDVRCLRRRVLLALHEGDLGPALPQSVGVHILGEEAMVRQMRFKKIINEKE